MSIGANISVITAGAILAFATHIHSSGISVEAVGGVLIVAGVVGLVLQISSLAKQRQLTTSQAEMAGPAAIAVRPAGAQGRPYTPSPYTGTTADPLPAEYTSNQPIDEYGNKEW